MYVLLYFRWKIAFKTPGLNRRVDEKRHVREKPWKMRSRFVFWFFKPSACGKPLLCWFARKHFGSVPALVRPLLLFFWRQFLSLLRLLASIPLMATCLCRNVQISGSNSGRGRKLKFNQCCRSVSQGVLGWGLEQIVFILWLTTEFCPSTWIKICSGTKCWMIFMKYEKEEEPHKQGNTTNFVEIWKWVSHCTKE